MDSNSVILKWVDMITEQFLKFLPRNLIIDKDKWRSAVQPLVFFLSMAWPTSCTSTLVATNMTWKSQIFAWELILTLLCLTLIDPECPGWLKAWEHYPIPNQYFCNLHCPLALMFPLTKVYAPPPFSITLTCLFSIRQIFQGYICIPSMSLQLWFCFVLISPFV